MVNINLGVNWYTSSLNSFDYKYKSKCEFILTHIRVLVIELNKVGVFKIWTFDYQMIGSTHIFTSNIDIR